VRAQVLIASQETKVSIREFLAGRKRLALVGALAAALVAGAIAIPLTSGGTDNKESSRHQDARHAAPASNAERAKEKPGSAAEARKRSEGSSQRDAGRPRRRSKDGDSEAASKLPHNLLRELRRRNIPLIELKPGKGKDATDGLPGGEQLDPRTLRKLLEQK
jgi:hypothetical protein